MFAFGQLNTGGFAGFNALEQPGHIAAQHAHNLHAFQYWLETTGI